MNGGANSLFNAAPSGLVLNLTRKCSGKGFTILSDRFDFTEEDEFRLLLLSIHSMLSDGIKSDLLT